MGIYLLGPTAVGPSITGNPADFHSIDKISVQIRISAFGGFGGSPVLIDESPDDGTTWINVGSLLTGQQMPLAAPIGLVRARTDSSLTGTAVVIAEPNA